MFVALRKRDILLKSDFPFLNICLQGMQGAYYGEGTHEHWCLSKIFMLEAQKKYLGPAKVTASDQKEIFASRNNKESRKNRRRTKTFYFSPGAAKQTHTHTPRQPHAGLGCGPPAAPAPAIPIRAALGRPREGRARLPSSELPPFVSGARPLPPAAPSPARRYLLG